jgi:serine-type D-Ala-D-Ala carboxypeptidase (penicillin-binding protein 5/6)
VFRILLRVPKDDSPNYPARRFFVGLLSIFILLVTIGVPTAILAPVPVARATMLEPAAATTTAADPRFPSFGHAAIGAVGLPGLLASHGSQEQRPIASITKVVTALVVLERKPLDGAKDQGPTITFGEKDVTILQDVLNQQGSWQAVQSGWKLSERQSLETMLIPSANNYAESLAIWAYGSVPKYLTAARAFLKAHGLTHTTLVDTNGLDSGDRSTPGDLVALGKLAIANPVLASIVRMRSATEPNIGSFENTNELLGTYGVNGLKTGTTDEAGACLLFAAKVKVGERSVELVGVILGATTHARLDATVPALLTSVRNGLHDVRLADRQQAFGTYHTKWGGIAKAVAARDAHMLVWGRTPVQRVADASPIRGGEKGERVGQVTYRVGSRTVTVPLVLDRSVFAAPIWWRLTHPLR